MKHNVIPLSDHEQLVARWQQGDVRVAEVLYVSHREQAFRLAWSLLDDRAEAEDVAQEALSHALLHPERYEAARGRFAAWLHGIVVRMCRARLRRRRRRERLRLWSWLRRPAPVAPPTPEETLGEDELRASLWRAVQALPAQHREAIVLRVWGGHTYRELAEIIGCPQRTAQSRVRLALARLRDALDHHLAPSDVETR